MLRYLLLWVTVFTACCSRLWAQDATPANFDGRTITAIEVEGNKQIGKDQLLAPLRTRVGQVFKASDLREDVKDAFKRFGARVEVQSEAVGQGGVRLVFVVEESQRIERVETRGVETRRGNQLLDDVGLRDARGMFESVVRERARELEKRLKDDGKYFSKVEVAIEPRDGSQIAVLTITESPEVAVETIEIHGIEEVEGLAESAIRDLMTTDTATLGIIDHSLRQDEIERDLAEIEGYLRREGWRDGSAQLTGVEFNEAKDEAIVRIEVVPGTRTTVEEIQFSGVTQIPEVDLRALLEIQVGAPLRMTVVGRDQQRIAEAYGEKGYARVNVVPRVILAEEGPRARLRFEVTEGALKHVRDVRILGNAATLDEVIRRRLTLEPGDVASSLELKRSADRLRALRYFDDAEGRSRVDVRFESSPDPLLEDVYVDVDEAHAGRLFFSVFASTDLGLFGGIQLQLDNFDITDTPSSWDLVTLVSELMDQRAFHGAGQQLDISLLPGTKVSSYRISFIEPYLFGPEEDPRSLRVDLYSTTNRLEDEFREVRSGLSVTLGKEWGDDVRAGVSGSLDFVNIGDLDDAPNDVEDVEGTNFVPSIGLFARYLDYDEIRDPKQGFEVGAKYDILFADGAGQRLVIDEKAKIPLLKDDKGRLHTLNIRSALGLANGFGGDLPFFERFQGGGAIGDFPIRGFEYRGIGPESKGVHLGGHFGYAATFEYEYPLYSSYDPIFDENIEYLRGVAFFDLASIEDSFSDLFGRTRASVGAGVRVKLPFLGPQPLAIDLGFPLLERADDDTEVLSVRLSYRF